MPTTRRAVFFDRDGVINRRIPGGYVRRPETLELLDDVADVLREVHRLGYLAIIITNQRGIGLGLMTEADLDAIHAVLQERMAAANAGRFDDIFFCPDASDESPRRKPSPQMILEAAERWGIQLSESWMVGDSPSDIEAGTWAGTRTAFLITDDVPASLPAANVTLHSLRELLQYL